MKFSYICIKTIGANMGRKSQRAKLNLTDKELELLIKVSNSKTIAYREVNRAKVLKSYSEGNSISKICRDLKISRESIYEYIDRGLSIGIEAALKDKYHSPKVPTITEEAKAWVVSLACTKPKDHGYASELWSYSQLSKHVRKEAEVNGHPSLSKAVKATIFRILNERQIKPHRIRYYLERRDPEFDQKMADILCVYKEVNLQNESLKSGENPSIITISIDEKPGIQAIKNIAPDINPKINRNKEILRDYEYKRLGTLSLLAGLDLHSGLIIAQVHERHRSREFISLLKEIDEKYPKECRIRIILDNHSAHISKETMNYLSSVPNRFMYIHTPKHGSWLNLVETLFGKMARTFLKAIRVETKKELKDRIMKGIEEINEAPVIYKWKNFDIDLSMF
jgi:transposase